METETKNETSATSQTPNDIHSDSTSTEAPKNSQNSTSSAQTPTTSSDGSSPATQKDSTIIKIYKQIDDVIGGTNPNEMFCMSMPGMILNPADYNYDTRFEKPFKVAANESRLVNKLYDPVRVVGSDNGRLLATQYKTALDSLTPKINRILIQAKNELRKMLKMPTTYTLDDGTTIQLPFQQLFYKLYEEYVDEKKSWSELQNAKREELLELYPGDSDQAKFEREERYLSWYQTVAESNLLKVNMKHGKILALFSDNDMKIIEGVLDAGIGAELQEAREQVQNARKFNPDGGYVYPVELEPSDWFKSLESGFSFIDLLQTSEHYALKYDAARKRRNTIANQIQLLEGSDKSSEVGRLVAEMDASQKDLDKVTEELDKAYGEGFATGVDAIVKIVKAVQYPDSLTEKDEKEIAGSALEKGIPFATIQSKMKELDSKQRAMDQAAMKVSEYAGKVILAETSNYAKEIKTLYRNLKEAQEEVDDLKGKLESALMKEQGKLNDTLFPNAVEGRYMQVNISSNSSEMNQTSEEVSSASNSSTGVSFLFGGYHSASKEASASAHVAMNNNAFSLDIGFIVTKVSITRNWFNPGVFLLSEDMYHTSKNRISFGEIRDKNASQCLFPCYPTAMVIAKDVSIKMKTESSSMDSMKSMMEKHASKGGGFLCFKTNSASSDTESSSSLVSTSTDHSIMIKIPGPQVIGYYLQSTPADKSESYIKDKDTEEMDQMITDFVSSYRKVLEEKV